MIAHIRGDIVEKVANSVIIDVGGVGYEVTLTGIDYERYVLGDSVKVFTYHHVREQSEELFGFSSLEGKKVFEMLITVQGVGPRSAMGILSLAPVEEVRNAIANSDVDFISKANGVGKKTAGRVIVDLVDKVGLPTYYGRKNGSMLPDEITKTEDEALEALIALGYTLQEASRALNGLDDPKLSTSERVRMALKT